MMEALRVVIAQPSVLVCGLIQVGTVGLQHSRYEYCAPVLLRIGYVCIRIHVDARPSGVYGPGHGIH